MAMDAHEDEHREIGRERGHEWALATATLVELHDLAEWTRANPHWSAIEVARDTEGTLFDELVRQGAGPDPTGRITLPRVPFIEGFVDGAAAGYWTMVDDEHLKTTLRGIGEEVTGD